MKLWQINVKLRRLSDRLGWPLVTRKRFDTMKANYDAELAATSQGADGYLAQLREARDMVRNLKQELAEAQRNDQRDPDTGRYTKAH